MDDREVLELPDVVRVECYAGYRGEQEPRRFAASDGPVEVVDIIDRWQGPDHRIFKVRGDDGGVHLLRQDEICDLWERLPAARGLSDSEPGASADES